MLDPFWTPVMIVAYVAIQIAIGIWFARRIRNETDYFVAGRSLGLLPVALSVFATWFGAETILSSSGEIASGGLAGGRAEPFGYAICLVAMALVIAGAFRAKGYLTLGDFFKDRFGRRAELACVWLTIPVSIIWAAAQLTALSVLLEIAMGVPPQVTLICATLVLTGYTVFSGLIGDVATDVVQSIVLIICLVVTFFAVAGHFGGPAGLVSAVKPDQLALIVEGESWLARVDAWAIPVLGSLVTQEAISRFLAAKSPKVARNACFGAAGLYLAVGMVPVLVGLAGAHVVSVGDDTDNFLPALLREVAPPIVFIAFSGALLSAILSTADSNILSVSSLITVNMLGRFHAQASERAKLVLARMTTVLASLIAYAIAAGGASIRDLITMTSVLGQAGLLIAVLIGLRSNLGSERAALGAVLACVLANVWTLVVIPAQTAIAVGGDVLATIYSGEAQPDGYFLYSVAAALAGYLAIAYAERYAARRKEKAN